MHPSNGQQTRASGQKAAAELESTNKHLQQVALDEEWFPGEN